MGTAAPEASTRVPERICGHPDQVVQRAAVGLEVPEQGTADPGRRDDPAAVGAEPRVRDDRSRQSGGVSGQPVATSKTCAKPGSVA